jgi:hypothetical protein
MTLGSAEESKEILKKEEELSRAFYSNTTDSLKTLSKTSFNPQWFMLISLFQDSEIIVSQLILLFNILNTLQEESTIVKLLQELKFTFSEKMNFMTSNIESLPNLLIL